MDPSASSVAAWVPPGQQEQDEGSRPVEARSQRPPAHWGTDAGRGEPRRPRDLHGLDPSESCTRRCSECAVSGGGSDAGSPPRGEHRSGASGGGGHSRPPPTGCGHPGATGGGTPLRSEWSRLPAAWRRRCWDPSSRRGPDSWSSSSSSRLGASSPSGCPMHFRGQSPDLSQRVYPDRNLPLTQRTSPKEEEQVQQAT
jgi:hypothetical protein